MKLEIMLIYVTGRQLYNNTPIKSKIPEEEWERNTEFLISPLAEVDLLTPTRNRMVETRKEAVR